MARGARVNTTAEDFENSKRAAVYGAMLALQVREYQSMGQGPPDEKMMECFVEEAEEVMCMAEVARISLHLKEGL